MSRASISLLFVTLAGMPAAQLLAAPELAFRSAPLNDAELAGSYGKFIAPGGIDLAMSVQSDTAIDGQLVLRSVFTLNQGPATLQVFAPAPGTTGPNMTSTAGSLQASGAPQNVGVSVIIDRTGATMSVSPTYTGSSATVPNIAVGAAGSASGQGAPSGLVPVAVTLGGPAVQTAAGVVSASGTVNGAEVTLRNAGLSISHLTGAATGSIIANSVDNRAIDTITSVAIDVRNAQALSVAASQYQVDGIVTAATGALLH